MKSLSLHWRRFIAKKTNKAILFLAVPLILIFFLIQIVIGYHIESTLIEMSFDRGQVISNDGINSFNIFIKIIKTSLLELADNVDVKNMTDVTQSQLALFLQRRVDTPIQGVSVTNTEGKVVYHLSKNGLSVIGTDVSDRDYFKWSRTAQKDELFIGQPVVSRVGVTKGQYIITVSKALFSEKGEWNGVITSVFPLGLIGKTFLLKNNLNPNTQIWLFNENGAIWYSPKTELIGTNVFEQLQPNSFPGSDKIADLVRESLRTTQNRFFQWWVPDIVDGHLERMLVTSSSVNIDNSQFTLAVLIPMTYVEGKYEVVHRWHTVMYLLVLGMILLFSIMLIVGIRQVQQISYQKGFVDASKTKKHPSNE